LSRLRCGIVHRSKGKKFGPASTSSSSSGLEVVADAEEVNVDAEEIVTESKILLSSSPYGASIKLINI
jgi:hypothetical protein